MVEDATAMIDEVAALGGTVILGPHEVPGGDTIVQCLDSQGAAFALYSETAG